jgi:hypothetical protein
VAAQNPCLNHIKPSLEGARAETMKEGSLQTKAIVKTNLKSMKQEGEFGVTTVSLASGDHKDSEGLPYVCCRDRLA